MANARDFVKAFLIPVGALCVGLYAVAAYLNLEPLRGGLTRLGGYSENDFGGHLPQEHCAQLYTDLEDTLEREADVVIIGDSFSTGGGGAFWQNYFYGLTGLRSVTVNMYHLGPFERLMEARPYKHHPPKLVICAIVERHLKLFFGSGA